MVQCVDIGNSTVLYVQRDIECHTWWQRATEGYIYLSIVPVFFVLSHAPFYVEDKTMSVRMFILDCLLPAPVMFIYCVQRYIRMRNVKKSLQLGAEVQSDTSSLSEQTAVSEQNQIERHVASNTDWNMKVDEFFLRMTENDTSSNISRDTFGQGHISSDSDMDIGSEYSTDVINGLMSKMKYL